MNFPEEAPFFIRDEQVSIQPETINLYEVLNKDIMEGMKRKGISHNYFDDIRNNLYYKFFIDDTVLYNEELDPLIGEYYAENIQPTVQPSSELSAQPSHQPTFQPSQPSSRSSYKNFIYPLPSKMMPQNRQKTLSEKLKKISKTRHKRETTKRSRSSSSESISNTQKRSRRESINNAENLPSIHRIF